MSPTPKKLAVFVSGTGTLLESFLNNGFHVDLVLGTDFSKNFDREAYTEQVLAVLQKHEIDVVAMAGFNTVLAPSIFEVYGGRILNTHPALLPSFKGHYAVRDALAYGVKVTG